MKIRKPVGIDLGTTNSVIAILDPTDTAIITGQDEDGRQIFPSVVGYLTENRQAVVGVPAARMKGQDVAPISSVKRSMGLDRLFTVGPDQLTPPYISARILNLLRNMLVRTLRDERFLIDTAIITMPAYFNHNQIEATRQAGELAGFEVVELLHEPTAAAIYYSWVENHDDATYLVYDLGGGTFDVSVIRKRYGDYEVLGVSGDPFLGGDDFDRLLASWIVKSPSFQAVGAASRAGLVRLGSPDLLPGTANFERLVHAAEGIKVDLSVRDRVERFIPNLFRDEQGNEVSFEVEVNRATFNRLIKEKVDRTIECCQEALHRARDKADVRLSDVDYVILVGGSSKIPLVCDTVRAAFCNPELPEHARCSEPLLHQPDLCVAYGAALRAATYGTRFLDLPGDLEMHLTSPPCTASVSYALTGLVRGPGAGAVIDGGSVRTQAQATGLVEEAFLESRGLFVQMLDLQADRENHLQLTICDPAGRDLARLPFCVRHQSQGRPLGQGVLPTQLITKPLQIQVLNRARQRIKQIIAPIGACLPGNFSCTCRTVDKSGRILVPIFEENRLIKQMVIDQVDPELSVGSPVDVEFQVDVKHNIQVQVKIRPGDPRRDGNSGRTCVTTAFIEASPPPVRPTRKDIEEVEHEIEELLREFSGSYRTRVMTQMRRLLQDLHEALAYEDEPKAIQRMAELHGLLQQLQVTRTQILDPPWPRFAHLVKHCLVQAGTVAQRTGRVREELFEQVYAQERYAEQAFEEKNQTLYQECFDNLGKLAGYLERLMHDALPRYQRDPAQTPEIEAQDENQRFLEFLAAVTERVKAKKRVDLQGRLGKLAQQGATLPVRIQAEPHGVIREARRLMTEIAKIEEELTGQRRESAATESGLLGL